MMRIFKIHILTYIIALIFIVVGYYKFYISFMLVLLIHELGHILSSLILKWHIKKIIILPLGMLLKFEDSLNKPLIEEFMIAVSGVLFQLIFIHFIHSRYLLISSNVILIFNILPIYPLDGSKVINIILNKINNFKTNYFLKFIISFITIVILISITIINKSLLFIISFIPLLINLIDLLSSQNKVFIKFLLERYIYNIKFKRHKYIKEVDNMKRDYYHYFIKDNNIIDEKDYLKKYKFFF